MIKRHFFFLQDKKEGGSVVKESGNVEREREREGLGSIRFMLKSHRNDEKERTQGGTSRRPIRENTPLHHARIRSTDGRCRLK